MASKGRWSDADFAPDVNAAAVQGSTPKSRLLLFFIILFFVGAVIWAKYAVIDEVTHADGKVVPSSRVQVIQNLEGGILKAVLVREGAIVEAGQVVLQIDDTGLSASFGEQQARYYSLLGEIERLIAEVEEKPLEFSPKLVAGYKEIVADQRALYQNRQAELKSQLAILRRQADQRKQEKRELEGKLNRLKSSLSIAKEEIAITEPLVEKNIVPKINLLRLRREINDLEGEVNASRLALPRVASSIREASRRIEEKVLNFKSGSLRELSQRKGDFSLIEESITAAKDKVVRTEVRSPVKGVVKELKIRTVGGVIRPGDDLMEIVPIGDSLRVEARIRPADVAFLHPGQDAVVKFTAYDFSIYGGLPGHVERISADTIVDERGEAFYKVIVITDRNNITRGDEVLPVIPGMVASVDVITGAKSVLNYLLKPLIKTQQKALTER
ncbi:MAG: HlyD family type I secretion periplasmic adaptor subunit [Sedimenticola sp.]